MPSKRVSERNGLALQGHGEMGSVSASEIDINDDVDVRMALRTHSRVDDDFNVDCARHVPEDCPSFPLFNSGHLK